MQLVLPWLVCGATAYLLGAMPTGFLVGLARGVDVRRVGSGNTGATNVFRTVGKPWGVFTLIVDALKGFVPAYLFPILAARSGWLTGSAEVVPGSSLQNLGLVCAAFAIAGHNWPVYLRFKGGKGVATSAGALLGLAPVTALIGFAAWLIVFAISRYVSLASMLAALVICITSWIVYYQESMALPIVFTVLCGVLIWRHRSNIQRLLQGKENKMGKRQGASGKG
jgi:glycerol-3-phosphate acyltransferase PlsY